MDVRTSKGQCFITDTDKCSLKRNIMKKFTVKNVREILDKSDNKLHLSDVIVQVCSTCKGHKVLLNEIGFPITCNECNGSGKQT